MSVATPESAVPPFLLGGGAMGERVRSHDWAATALGGPERWPEPLKALVGVMLAAQQPMFIAWGAERLMLFNDGYAELMGDKAAWGLGRPFADVWAEAMTDLQPLLDQIAAGRPVSMDDLRLVLDRRGRLEPAHFAFSYTPVRDAQGEVAGLFCACQETTGAVDAKQALEQSQGRLQTILDTVSEGFYATDPDWVFTVVNTAAERFFGRPREDVIGRVLWDVFPAAIGSEFERRFRKVMADGQPTTFETHSVAHPEILMEVRAARKANGGLAVAFSDITERRAAELRRRESEAVLRAFFDNEGLYASVLQLQGDEPVYVAGNKTFAALMGVDTVAGMTTAQVLGRRAVESTVQILRHVEMTGKAVRFEHAAAGRWFSATVSPIADQRRRRLFAATSIDISERRRAEEALRDSEARFRAITETLPQIVWSAGPDGLHDFYNARWYEFTGVAPGSADGKGWNDLFHPDDRQRAWAVWRDCLATGEDYQIEYRLRHRSGVYRWVLGRARAVRDPATGDIVRWMGTCTDIQEIVTAREVLTRSREELEAAVRQRTEERDRVWRQSRDLMVVIDRSGLMLDVNPAWTTILGYTPEELLGRSVFEVIVAEDETPTLKALDTAGGASLTDFENRYRHKDGGCRTIAWRTSLEGDLIYAYGRDVSEEKSQAERLALTEEQLRQSQKMEAVGQLTGGIAHDFNNLLQGITGSLDLIGKRVAQGRTGELGRYLDGAAASANRAAALTHRLLAFSRRQPLDPKPVEVNPLIVGIEDLLRRTLGENVGLDLVLPDDLWTTRCDANQLESALLNLAINARDAMPDGGRLTIETCNASVEDGPEGETGPYVCVRVADTGAGMPPEVLERAFEPFFTTKPMGQGTGLGLSMIYGFARQSEGFCRMESKPGQGTTVRLYLPRRLGEAAEDAPVEVAAPVRGRETVMVVEDEPVVRTLVVEALQELGYRTMEAQDGPDALNQLRGAAEIDLLLTDIGLPGPNGRQVAEAVRADRPGQKVLFMTGYAEDAVGPDGFLDHGMGLITKPFTIDSLTARVREMLET